MTLRLGFSTTSLRGGTTKQSHTQDILRKLKRFYLIVAFVLPVLLLCAGTQLHAQIKSVEKLIEQGKYNNAYQKLYTNYLNNPNDLETLLMLAKFYALPNNKVQNYRLSYCFTKEAEEAFRSAVKEKSGRKILRWKNKNIEYSTLKMYEQLFADSALREAELFNTVESYNDVLAFYTDHLNVSKVASELRNKKAFENAKQEHTIQAYNHFLTQYPFATETQEALIQRGELLYTQALLQQSEKELIKYSQVENDSKLQQLVAEKINWYAYQAALAEGTSTALHRFLSYYPASEDYAEALATYDSLVFKEATLSQTPKSYLDFAKAHLENPFYFEALDSLVKKMWQEKDMVCINDYLKTFPLDSHYPTFLKTLYDWYTVDGEKNLIESFQKQYPDFLYTFLLSDDLEKSQSLNQVNLLQPFNEKNFQDYLLLSRMFMGKEISFVLLQRTLENSLLNKNYSATLARLQNFELCFEEDPTYIELKSLLNNKANHTGNSQKIFSGYKERTHPVLAGDGEVLYFSELENGISNIYKSTKTRTGFSQAEKLKTINTSNQSEYPFGVDNDETYMLFGRNGDIWQAENINGNWVEKSRLPFPINTEYYETDATLVPDGSGILFVSDRKDGNNLQKSKSYFHGDTLPAFDIYFARKTVDGWDTPINLGLQINSRYCEQSPILAPDMRTLFFCSDAGAGLGRLDIMYAKRLNDTSWTNWSEPKNMGTYVNSPEQETNVAYSKTDNSIYYVSGGAKTPDNIYRTKLLQKIESRIFALEVHIADTSAMLLPFNLDLVNPSDQAVLKREDGHVAMPTIFTLAVGKPYSIFASKKGYLAASLFIAESSANDVKKQIKFHTIKELQDSAILFPLNNIAFTHDGNLTQNAIYELKMIVKQLTDTKYAIQIGIEADIESQQDFDIVSKRVALLKAFLIKQGLNPHKIITTTQHVKHEAKNETVFLKILKDSAELY